MLFMLFLLFLPLQTFANDGIDRYSKPYPIPLYLFPPPIDHESGYIFLESDTPAGADGNPSFRWARRHTIAVIRVCANAVIKAMGIPRYPMAIFDLSAENGDTPVDFSGIKPVGRHPGGSHDGGLNLDLGYYLISLKGKKLDLDHSACTEHYKGDEDEHLCIGVPDKLDVERQTCFLVHLFKINRELFEGDLLEEIGIDNQIRKVILAKAYQWVANRDQRCQVTKEIVSDMENIMVSDPFEGWARYHHHHIHVRFKDIEMNGRYRRGYKTLLDMETLAIRRNGKINLEVIGSSTKLKRQVEISLLGNPMGGETRFRIKNGEWIAPDPSSPYPRCVIDVPTQVNSFDIEAKYEINGKDYIVTKRFEFPPQDKKLYAFADPRSWHTIVSSANGMLTFAVDVPQISTIYITDTKFVVTRENGIVEDVVPPPRAFSITLDEKGDPIILVTAVFTLSSRMKVDVTVYCK